MQNDLSLFSLDKHFQLLGDPVPLNLQ